MTHPTLETLRDLTERAAGAAEMPPDLLERVRRRRRRSAITMSAASAAAVAAVVAVVGVVVSNATAPRHGVTSHRPGAASKPTPMRQHADFPPLQPRSTPHDSGEPATLLASIGGGAERLAIVDSHTGAVRRYLQSTGSQALMVLAADGRTAYQWDQHGCRYTWTAINTRTGRSTPALGSLGNVSDIAFSPTGQRMAYVSIGRQRMVTINGHRYHAGCSTAPRRLVVTDETTGASHQWQLPSGSDEALYPAFDATATHVAFVLGKTVHLLDIQHDATLAAARPLPVHSGCSLSRPTFRPGTTTLLVDEWCGVSHAPAIVGYDVRTGREVYRHTVGTPGSFVSYFTVDATGHHVLYSRNGSVYAVEPGGDRHVLDDTYQMFW